MDKYCNPYISYSFGYPSPPADPFAVPISPDTLYLFWKLPETLNAPKKEIKYRVRIFFIRRNFQIL